MDIENWDNLINERGWSYSNLEELLDAHADLFEESYKCLNTADKCLALCREFRRRLDALHAHRPMEN